MRRLAFNKRLIEALNIINIKVLDHIILGKNFEDYFSLCK
ncbi:MAG: JAB domain-containing protein [Caldisericum exile]